MKIDLTGKTAIVTGSTGGIGFAIAKGLVQARSAVVLNGREQNAVDKAIARLQEDVPDAEVRGIAADVGTSGGCSKLIAAEPIADILINNVGIFGPQNFFDTPD